MRIFGVNIPDNKKIEISLMYLYGVGRTLAAKTLKATGVDPERKSGGFKESEVHLRRTVSRLDDTILALPEEQRAAFQSIRRELDDMDRELFNLLFPRQPGKSPPKKKWMG